MKIIIDKDSKKQISFETAVKSWRARRGGRVIAAKFEGLRDIYVLQITSNNGSGSIQFLGLSRNSLAFATTTYDRLSEIEEKTIGFLKGLQYKYKELLYFSSNEEFAQYILEQSTKKEVIFLS